MDVYSLFVAAIVLMLALDTLFGLIIYLATGISNV